jgi:hypothetical protein
MAASAVKWKAAGAHAPDAVSDEVVERLDREAIFRFEGKRACTHDKCDQGLDGTPAAMSWRARFVRLFHFRDQRLVPQ